MLKRLLQVDRGIGLGNELQILGVHGALGVGAAIAAGYNDGQARKAPPHFAGQVLAAHSRQAKVGQKQVERPPVGQQFKRLFAAARLSDDPELLALLEQIEIDLTGAEDDA